MIVFTIASRNFFSHVQVLHESLSSHHPGMTFYCILCDRPDNFDISGFKFEIVELDRLGIPKLEEMQQRYNIAELNTSIKPFGFSYLFDRHPGSPIVYFDSDIFIISRMEELLRILDDGADCVVTPHITEPAEFAEMHDQKFLQYGIYNCGFCVLRDTPQVRRIASWWGRRLESQCVVDLPSGLFVDQKWVDLFPAFIENTVILRHPGYNVAYWNLSQRRLSHFEGEWSVNSAPLRFIHFSGNTIEDETRLSRHSGVFAGARLGAAKDLLAIYRQRLFENGHGYYSQLPYAFSRDAVSGANPHAAPSINTTR
jgi:hypothetical protein